MTNAKRMESDLKKVERLLQLKETRIKELEEQLEEAYHIIRNAGLGELLQLREGEDTLNVVTKRKLRTTNRSGHGRKSRVPLLPSSCDSDISKEGECLSPTPSEIHHRAVVGATKLDASYETQLPDGVPGACHTYAKDFICQGTTKKSTPGSASSVMLLTETSYQRDVLDSDRIVFAQSNPSVINSEFVGDVDGRVYFQDDLENFNVMQEETVLMESTLKRKEKEHKESATFVPPSKLSLDPESVDSRVDNTNISDVVSLSSCGQQTGHQQTEFHKQNLCGECGKTFKSKRNLQKHIKVIHHSEEIYTCKICHKVFHHFHNLNRHKQNQVHYGNGEEHLFKFRKLFECPVCRKAFSYKCNLRDHQRLHSGERPFKCSYCSLKFVQSSNCKKHELTHTKQRPHACDLCSKAFACSSNLKRHRLGHIQQKNFLCSICGKGFSQKWNLKEHETVKHNN